MSLWGIHENQTHFSVRDKASFPSQFYDQLNWFHFDFISYFFWNNTKYLARFPV